MRGLHNPLPWQTWKKRCTLAGIDSPLSRLVINDIRHGCDPGFPLSAKPRSVGKNFVDPEKTISVFKDIINGLYVRFLEGPFDPNSAEGKETILSPLQTVDKPGSNKVRVIHNLSKNKKLGVSVNSFINDNARTCTYTNLSNIVKLLSSVGPNAYCSVWDMFEAYRQVKIQPQFHRFLGFQWMGKIYRYTCLPFGLASAPKKYSEFAEIVRNITIHSNP